MKIIWALFMSVLLICCSGNSSIAKMTRDAIAKNNSSALSEILDKHGLSKVEKSIGSPLLLEINGPQGMNGRDLILAAIRAGADVNANEDGDTVLMRATMWLYAENAAVLVEKGSNINARAKDGARAFDFIPERGDERARDKLKRLLKPEVEQQG